ncbi:MAG: sulfite exporter TauE/SafE family protein [Geodermatophilaceae bacterium]|nr:sulfite exporter TauE/SafE family protein [Geodermatophilaceae bacterium]
MPIGEVLALFAAGLAAGTVNTIVGSGSLITFPTLLAFGYPPLLANVTNNIGVLPGAVSGVAVSRRELRGQRPRLIRLGAGSLLGATAGALLLLWLPEAVFDGVVPVLILLACALVAVQPRVTAAVRRRGRPIGHGGVLVWTAVLLTGVYGGYFGAAQGVILIAVLGMFLADDLPRLNAAKNVLAGLANLAAAIVFVAVTEVAWLAALALAVGSAIGGQFGPRIGRRLTPAAYRTVIVVVGVAVSVVLLVD